MSPARHSPARVLVRGAVVGVATAIALHPSSDPDLWGHLRYGLDFLSTRTIPSADVYSFTSDRAWINHEWLTEALLASAYRLGGTIALALLAASLVLASLAVIRWSLRHSNATGWRLELLTAVTWLIGVAPLVLTLRPQAVSALLFVTLLTVLREFDRGRDRALIALPFIFLVWANLHGAWVMAAGVLAIWTFVRVVQAGSSRTRLALLAAGVSSAAATILNPYGVELWRFLFETLRVQRADIIEWGSLVSSPIMFVPWAATLLAALLVLVRVRREHVAYLAVSLLLAVASFRVIRLVPFFSLAVLMLLGPLLAEGSAPAAAPARFREWAGAVLVWGICVASSMTGGARIGCLQSSGGFHVDERAAQFLRENQVAGRLLVWFDWGEYVTWHFGKALQVSMDGRRETVYSLELLKAHSEFYRNEQSARGFLDRISPDYIWLPASLPVSGVIQRWGWQPIFETESSTVWARGNAGKPWRQPPPVTSSCFPAA